MKRLLLFALLLAFGISPAGQVSAQAGTADQAIKPTAVSSPFLGQDHRYSVTFRGNGQAVVTARIHFTNEDVAPMSAISFRVPRATPSSIIAYQVFPQATCIQYEPMRPQDSKLGMPYPGPQKCIQYMEPDENAWYNPAKYQKAETSFSGDTLMITLPQDVGAGKSGTVFLYYRAVGYAKKNIVGGFHYVFESLQMDSMIRTLQVGISTDGDWILKGAKGDVSYRFEDAAIAMAGTEASYAPAVNSRMDSYYQQIGQGEIVKTAKDLDALESYKVEGSYARSMLQLFYREFAWGIGILAVVAFIIYRIVRMLSGKKTKESSAHPVHATFILVGSVSALSSLFILAFTAVVVLLVSNMNRTIPYEMQTPLTILVFVLALGVYGFLLAVPPLYIGMRRGLWSGIATLGCTILWLTVAVCLYILFMFTQGYVKSQVYSTVTAEPAMRDGYGVESAPGMEQGAPDAVVGNVNPDGLQ